ncbi:hypothetical protein ZHAS_00001877 [Anopheles sinensis]|uniref:Uncharacterized protein n=1 Tax=Anopheles sinensis TaxID=74873 RepID=A0A084VBM2_ANOSI|nr:hypothetical protein ZHAS_00001877 [Anopheles sinensis]
MDCSFLLEMSVDSVEWGSLSPRGGAEVLELPMERVTTARCDSAEPPLAEELQKWWFWCLPLGFDVLYRR